VSLGTAGGDVRLEVCDDGAGFDPAAAPRGQGLANLRARAEEFGGIFEVSSTPGAGARVAVAIPYDRPEPAAAYRRKAIEFGAALLACIVLLIWRGSQSMAMWMALAAAGTIRYAVAYRRARARAL
jgi:hypothetical protein